MAQGSDKHSTPSKNERDSLGGAGFAGESLGQVGVGHGLAAAAAQVREEVEDILAGAQSIRRGERD